MFPVDENEESPAAPSLEAVEDTEVPAESAPSEGGDDDRPKRGAPHLRVVK